MITLTKLDIENKVVLLFYQARTALCSLLLFCLCCSAQAEWITSLELGAGHDNNLTNAQYSKDIAESIVATTSVTTSYFQVLGKSLTASYSLSAQGESVSSVSGLDNLSIGGSVFIKQKLGLGRYVPWLGLSVASTNLDYRSNSRDGWRHQISLHGGKRLSARWNWYSAVVVEARKADLLPPDEEFESGDVFSQDSITGSLNVEHTLTNSLLLNLGIMYRDGDITSTATESYYFTYTADAAAEDPIFTTSDEIYAYRLKGKTRGINSTLTYSPTIRDNIGLQASYFDTDAKGNASYTSNIWRLFWNHSF